MMKYLAMLVAMLALVSLGAATFMARLVVRPPPSCTDGVCDYNSITQTNVADWRIRKGLCRLMLGRGRYGQSGLEVRNKQELRSGPGRGQHGYSEQQSQCQGYGPKAGAG